LAVEKIKISYEVAGKKELAAINEELLQMIKKNGLLQKEIEDTIEKFKNQGKQADGLSGTLKKTAGILAGVFAADKIIDFGKEVFRVRGEMQRFAAVLTNTLGSKSAAQEALKTISKFAAETPFSVSQLTASFVKLANQGFKPSAVEMRKLGDLASSTGKEFDQLAEAIIDAQTGEFERLKEFGIRASKQGDLVKFTFKGVETQTKFTSSAITDYVLSLGDLAGVSGSMAAISTTLEGRISNLGDSYETLLNSIGTRGEGIFAGAIGALGDLINATNEWVAIPAAEAIQNEQIELNNLVGALGQANISEDARKKLIEDISVKFPSFLEGNLNEDVEA
jgi:phage tail tape-measure protein